MNWHEAREAMKQGIKVRNPDFSSADYFHMTDGKIYDDAGVPLVGWYEGGDWIFNGWSIVENRV